MRAVVDKYYWIGWLMVTPCKQLYLSMHWRDAVKPHIAPELGLVFTWSKFMKIPCYSLRASMQSWPRWVKILARHPRILESIDTWRPFLVGQRRELEDYCNRITTLDHHVWAWSLSLSWVILSTANGRLADLLILKIWSPASKSTTLILIGNLTFFQKLLFHALI